MSGRFLNTCPDPIALGESGFAGRGGCDADLMRPVDFSIEYSEDWARWVLDQGLPELPEHIGLDESVPVAYWRGDRIAAVLFVRRWFDARPHELLPDEDCDEQERTDLDADLFRLVHGEWTPFGSGGANWHCEEALTAPVLDPNEFSLSGMYGAGDQDGQVLAIYGYLGEHIAYLEVEQDGTTRRHTVDAPLRAAVVALESRPFTVRGLAEDGTVIGSITETAGTLDEFWTPPHGI